VTDPSAPEGAGIDSWIRPLFEDSALWPLLIVAGAIAVTIGSTLLLLAFAERNPMAFTGALIALWMSIDIVVRDRRRGRFGLTSRCVAVLWAACISVAIAALQLEIF
jgi:hypothetical protein